MKKVKEWVTLKCLKSCHSATCHPYIQGRGQFLEGDPRGEIFKEHKQQAQRNSFIMDYVSVAAPQATRRLLKDIQNAQQDIMKQQGIWYFMNETDMTKGLALLKGPDDTPYDGCLLLFSVKFPYDYPFSPPKVLFLTSDGKTRFHPNLYVEGKVCLSILGTFSGPSWSGTQSLTSVLLSILALLDTNPLSHEPAFERGTLLDARHRDYADFVEHQMTKLMLQTIQRFEQKETHHPWNEFEEIVSEQLPSLKERLRKKILQKAEQPERLWGSVSYGMGGRSYWKQFARETPWIQTT
jgi:ubiquitin-protein ligase